MPIPTVWIFIAYSSPMWTLFMLNFILLRSHGISNICGYSLLKHQIYVDIHYLYISYVFSWDLVGSLFILTFSTYVCKGRSHLELKLKLKRGWIDILGIFGIFGMLSFLWQHLSISTKREPFGTKTLSDWISGTKTWYEDLSYLGLRYEDLALWYEDLI